MRRSYKNLRGARLNRVYKGETDRDYIDGSWRVRNLMKALRTHEVSLAECRQRRVRKRHLRDDEPSASDKIACFPAGCAHPREPPLHAVRTAFPSQSTGRFS